MYEILPQAIFANIDFNIKGQFILAQIVNFGLLAFVIYRFAFKPILGTLEERQKKIADGLQYAEEMKARLADAEKQHAEAVKKASLEAAAISQSAKDNAEAFLEKKKQEAIAEAESIIKRANADTERERQKMLGELRKEVAQLVVATTSKVLSKELTDGDKTKFSDAAAKELYAN